MGPPTGQQGGAAVDGGARARRHPRPRRAPRPPAKGPGACAPKAGTAPQGLPAAPGPFLKGGPAWPHHHTGGQAGPHPTGGAPNQPEGPQARQAKEGGPSPRGGPPDAAGADKMQGRPRPKGIKAGPCILPLHFGRGCGMALPPPRPADRPRDDRWRRPPKRNKGACAGWRPAAPGTSVPGVSAVEWLG